MFYADDMALEPIRQILTGPVNDVCVCRDVRSPLSAAYYTLVTVKDRACVKELTLLFESSEKTLADDARPYLSCFTQNELLCYVFPYRPERRMGKFAPGQMNSVSAWESACVNLVLELLSSPLPFPLLALALRQGDVHVEKDQTVFLTPYFDLSGLNPQDGEADCARAAVELMLSIRPDMSKKVKSAQLMRKKLSKNAYQSLPELYRDIRVTAVPTGRQTPLGRLKDFWLHNKDALFRLLLILCGLLTAFALAVLISQLIFGDVPLFRLFEGCFDRIGTLSLL